MIDQASLARILHQRVTSCWFDHFESAARAFVDCYRPYAAQVTSGTGGRPSAIDAALEPLCQQLITSYRQMQRMFMAQTLQKGLMQFWISQPWQGGSGPGMTQQPGHLHSSRELYQLYCDGITLNDPWRHASRLAAICSDGLRQVIIIEYPPLRPPDVTAAV